MKNHQIIKQAILFILLFSSITTFAQQTGSLSIDEQFKQITETSNNYQEYKVIKKTELQKLWKNTNDTIKAKQLAYAKTQNSTKEKDLTIAQLKQNFDKKNAELTAAINANNEILLLGFIPLSKSSYNFMMCGIIILLIAAAGFFYFRSQYANRQASEKTALYNEVSEEYKTFKSKAHENEKKLARALQDERNKLAEHNIL